MGIWRRLVSSLRLFPAWRRRGKLDRNDPCWCGSGKKYKRCHLNKGARGGPGKDRPLPPPENPRDPE